MSEPCNCENNTHFDDGPDHKYLGVPAGDRKAYFVGPICDDCANGHYADMLMKVAS